MTDETKAVEIYEGQDFYVPYFQVKLRGRPLGQDVVRDILQVSYKDSITEIDSFEISINNWDADQRSFKFSDDDLFNPGKELELWMGYYGRDRLRKMTTGEITSLRPSFPASGGSTLVISGLSLLHRLRKKQESFTYENLTDSQIASKIATRLNMNLHAPNERGDEEKYEYLFQDNQYDIIFLMERARRVGYDLFIEEEEATGAKSKGTLFFGPSVDVKRVSYRLTYGRSLIEFQPDLTTANQVGKVTVRGWNAKKKTKIEKTVTREALATKGVGKDSDQDAIEASFADREEIITDRPVRTEKEAQTLAKETLERIAKDMIKGTGSTVGLPDLRAGSVLIIDGLGERFSGRYFVTGTTHTIGDGGYTTQFECRREELKKK